MKYTVAIGDIRKPLMEGIVATTEAPNAALAIVKVLNSTLVQAGLDENVAIFAFIEGNADCLIHDLRIILDEHERRKPH